MSLFAAAKKKREAEPTDDHDTVDTASDSEGREFCGNEVSASFSRESHSQSVGDVCCARLVLEILHRIETLDMSCIVIGSGNPLDGLEIHAWDR